MSDRPTDDQIASLMCGYERPYLPRAEEIELIEAMADELWMYRRAMRDVRRILTDLGVTNLPVRLRNVLEGLDQ